MNSSTLIKAITVLGTLTIANICGILGIGYYNAQPYSDYSIDTLGAVFHQPTEDNVVEVSLVRPPRQTVHPGETARYEGFITNPNNNPIHCRSTYQVIIKDGQGKVVEGMNTEVSIVTNEDWYFQDGYWHYKEGILENQEAPALIDTISYSDAFSEHLDYKVYVYQLTEIAEEKDGKIAKWPNKDINDLHKEANSKSATWTNTVKILG